MQKEDASSRAGERIHFSWREKKDHPVYKFFTARLFYPVEHILCPVFDYS